MKYLLDSLHYAIKTTKKLIDNNEPTLVAEPLLNIARNFYLYRTKKDPFAKVSKLLVDAGVQLTDSESDLLNSIEIDSRNKDKYTDTAESLDLAIVRGILDKIEDGLG